MSKSAEHKILAGLEDAVRYAKCNHEFIVQHIHEMSDGRARIRSRCDRCGGHKTEYTDPGAVEFVNVIIR